MRINEKLHYDYNDVLIKPIKSSVYSRKDVDLERTIYFPMSKQTWTGVPIMSSNMDTIGTYEVYQVLNQEKIITCFHKFYSVDDFKKMDLNPDYFAISTGINDNDLEKLDSIINEIEVKFICIDVANGYMDKLIDICRKIRKLYPNKILIAGNVVCSHRTKELIKKGFVDIVKVGIGSGCFEGNTKILMANGLYKPIKEIMKGEWIINKDGKPVEVLNLFYKGKKHLITIKTNNSLEQTFVTPDHQYWVANLDHLSISTVKKGCIQKLIEKNKNIDKYKWVEINEMNTKIQFGLFPKNITWNLPEIDYIDLSEFKSSMQEYDDKFIYIGKEKYKRYLEMNELLGNVIGSFLMNQNKIKVIKDYVNDFEIYKDLHSHESLIQKFLSSLGSTLPSKYYCINHYFIKGIYKGLLNINSIEYDEPKHTWNLHKNLIELMYFCVMSLGFNYKLSSTDKTMIIKKNEETEKFYHHNIKKINSTSNLIDTFDIEVNSHCHSFIANNTIVHNSACLTRTQTGIGVPQLSAIDDCAIGAHDVNGFIIGDGGITNAGDISKGFGAGADFIMIGGLFGGHDENPGEIILKGGKKYKQFYGTSSDKAMNTHYGKKKEYCSSEGRTLEIPYKGILKNTLEDLLGGVRSSCTYIGANKIEQIPEKCQFIRVNNQLNKMYDTF